MGLTMDSQSDPTTPSCLEKLQMFRKRRLLPRPPDKPTQSTSNSSPSSEHQVGTLQDEDMNKMLMINETHFSDREGIMDGIHTLHSKEQIAAYTTSIIDRELKRVENKTFSGEIEILGILIKDISEADCALLTSFLEAYCDEQIENPYGTWHCSLIEFLTQLIKISLGDDGRIFACCSVLATLSQFDANLVHLGVSSTPAAILGCMSAHLEVCNIQDAGAFLLGRFSAFPGIAGFKPPLKEGAVDILVRSAHFHRNKPSVLLSIITTLGDLVSNAAATAETLVEDSNIPLAIRQDSLAMHLSLLDHIEKTALPLARSWIDDEICTQPVKEEAKRMVEFFRNKEESVKQIRRQSVELDALRPVGILRIPTARSTCLKQVSFSEGSTLKEEDENDETIS